MALTALPAAPTIIDGDNFHAEMAALGAALAVARAELVALGATVTALPAAPVQGDLMSVADAFVSAVVTFITEIKAINVVQTAAPAIPARSAPATFVGRASLYIRALTTLVSEYNANLDYGTPRTLTFGQSASSTADLTTYTFSAQAIPDAPSADRRVYVGIMGVSTAAARTISSVSIGGVTADVSTQYSASEALCIASAAVPTGTTADVVVTFSGACSRASIGLWSSIGLTTGTPVDSGTSLSANPTTDTLGTELNGFCIAIALSTIATTVSWSAVTEKYDAQIESITTFSGASSATTGANITPAATFASGAGTEQGLFATW